MRKKLPAAALCNFFFERSSTLLKNKVSRTIGDIESKLKRFGGMLNVVSAVPEITTFKLNDDQDFILLGCTVLGADRALCFPTLQNILLWLWLSFGFVWFRFGLASV